MHSRQSLIEIFSTFIEFRSDRFNRWVVDPRLRRNFEQHQDQLANTEPSEDFWSLYWHSRWKKQPDDIALGHLAAYLQEAWYWSAQRSMRMLSRTSYRLSDCFQLANIDLAKVLAGYDPRRGASLKGYARIVYASLIRDTLRQRQEADICTVWTLLRRVSKQRMVEALRHAGLSPTAIAQYRLAWVCYKTLYGAAKAHNRKLRAPDREQWIAIANLYNAERLMQLSEPGAVLTPADLEQRLAQCAAWVREYMYPTVQSLNVPSPNREVGELQDELSDSLQSSLINAIIELEDGQQRQMQQAHINTVLIAAIGKLTPDNQAMLHLYYGDGLTQVQIAQQLDIKQYTVSRRLTRTRENLLRALIAWAKTMHISPSPDLITNMSVALEEWLTVHHRNQS
ncbi:sigma-70 family RNA polymerase sigma factor [Leptothoe sp. LEGE 181152]|uniref:Sigma-70 family RNA polymerase sigma factor n=1 Tax=Adonisia turfae CCMR0081 TaxID=2292702 RepID=A0A6M0RVI2_9CYAN|nr:sigma-70 family RNA polymerase sigma factor [Adonisia turfae]MDV3350655.1 sigma-70 family RNA polymerase sigma factor [Leptothoe sp. LEGE 181152]NEZ60265.1 sigma-70 family RNA polymerase sigma factor [Adonisia turfae CCMR0081]